MSNRKSFLLAALAVVFVIAAYELPQRFNGQTTAPEFDPVSMDPEIADPALAPSFVGGDLDVDGSIVNVLWFEAGGAGPFPTIVFLHGYPGNEKNLDLARVLQRAGFNVLFIHYRGTWGSGGFFTFSNALEDAAEAVEFIRTKCYGDSDCAEIPVDPARIGLFGHSMGGWFAMVMAIENPKLSCAAILDFGMITAARDLAEFIDEYGEMDPEWIADEEWYLEEGRPLRIEGPGALTDDLLTNLERLDVTRRVPELAMRRVFLLSSDANEQHPLLVKALLEHNAAQFREETWATDHSFNNARVRMARAMVKYFSEDCFK